VSTRVARRKRRGKPAKVSATQRYAQQRAVRAALSRQIATLVQQTLEQALAEEVTVLLGRARYVRRRSGPQRRAGTVCSHCQLDWAPRFSRAGSYRRTLLTLDAQVTLRVPRVSCVCGGTVPLEFATFGRYERTWEDVQARARQLSGLCLALRDIREVLAGGNGTWLAPSTVYRWVHEAAGLAATLRGAPLGRIPPVVLLDGLWLKLMEPTGERYQDRQGRERARVRRVKVPLLVAYGVDPATGERWLLDWEQTTGEDEASWRGLLERLQARGVRADAGLVLFVHDGSAGLEAAFGQVDFGPAVLRQRCVFHVLRNLGEHVQGTPGQKRAARRAHRRALLQEAARIWEPLDATAVRARYRAFCAQWRETEPAVVAALRRLFPLTLPYLEARARGREWGQDWPVQALRTTSPLERLNRILRQKARQVGTFQSRQGLTAAVVLVLVHHGATALTPADDLWTEVLEAGLLAA
jgi:transposase-like protein